MISSYKKKEKFMFKNSTKVYLQLIKFVYNLVYDFYITHAHIKISFHFKKYCLRVQLIY